MVVLYSVRWLNSCASVGKFIREMIESIDGIEFKEVFVEDEQVRSVTARCITRLYSNNSSGRLASTCII